MKSPRYIVSSVTGYDSPDVRAGGPRTSYYVLDTAYCHRVVASIPSDGRTNGRSPKRLEKARALADSLNRGEQAWLDALARESEFAA